MPVKLQDIATEPVLSIATISCVVNRKDRVDPNKQQTVSKTLDEYGYRPNKIICSL